MLGADEDVFEPREPVDDYLALERAVGCIALDHSELASSCADVLEGPIVHVEPQTGQPTFARPDEGSLQGCRPVEQSRSLEQKSECPGRLAGEHAGPLTVSSGGAHYDGSTCVLPAAHRERVDLAPAVRARVGATDRAPCGRLHASRGIAFSDRWMTHVSGSCGSVVQTLAVAIGANAHDIRITVSIPSHGGERDNTGVAESLNVNRERGRVGRDAGDRRDTCDEATDVVGAPIPVSGDPNGRVSGVCERGKSCHEPVRLRADGERLCAR